MQKSMAYYKIKTKIDKAQHKNTAYKVQIYANKTIDDFVANFNDAGASSKPSPAMLSVELAILNKPEVYKNYNRIINSPYTSNDNLNKMLVKASANKQLDSIVKSEMERIAKNVNFVEAVMKKYDIPTQQYQQLVKEQANKSIANRKNILEQVAIKNGEILKSEGLNIPSNVFSYKDIETTAQSLLRESQMTSKFEEIQAINDEYLSNGKDAPYTHKQWIWTGEGATTRHESNHLQKVRFDEPFIVVNDNTLDIDEMMYPCDPDGSYSNAYICYCDIDYLIGEDDEYGDNLGLGTILDNAEVFSENTPASSYEVGTIKFLPNIEGLFEKPKGEYIETKDLFLDEKNGKPAFLLDETDGAFINENGNWEYKGLEADKPMKKIENGGWWYEESVIKHNYEVTGEQPNETNVTAEDILPEAVENKTLTGEVEYTGEPIDLTIFGDTTNYVVLDSDGITHENGKHYWKGVEVKSYNESVGGGFVYLEDAIEHNKKLGVEDTYSKGVNGEIVKGEPIDTSILDNTVYESGAYDIDPSMHPELKDDIKLNEATGKYEYKGLEIEGDYEKDGYGWIEPEAVVEHNKQFDVETEIETNKITTETTTNKVTEPEYIMIDDYGVWEKDTHSYYLDQDAGEVKFNSMTGKYEIKGLELDTYYPDTKMGVVSKEKLHEHNSKYADKQPTPKLRNKYIEKMDSIKTIDKNGEIYIEDKATGKKYVYDEKATYEEAQDKAQMKINYKQSEYDSTAHWGQYGHQILNGLIYSIEKYGYDAYKPYLDRAKPLINELRTNSKEILRLQREGDFDNKLGGLMQNEIRLMDKLGEIVDNIPRQSECTAGLQSIKNALWEMVYMDKSIMKSPALMQDTFLVRFGHFTEADCQVGKTVKLDGYTSTTYESKSASHFEDKMAENPNRWAILIMADEGTGGIRLNDQFDALTTEREWLLPRDQEFEVVEYDKDMRTVVLRVIKNNMYN